MLAQSSDGAALVLHAARDLDFDQLEAQLAQSGYARKDPEADSWLGGGEVASTLGITPELQNLILLPDDRLVVASDRAAYAAQVAEVARGERDHLSGLDHLIASAGTPASAVLLAGSYACEHLAMGQADEADQAEGAELIAQAGDVGPLDGYLVAAQTARRGRILLGVLVVGSCRTRGQGACCSGGRSGAGPGWLVRRPVRPGRSQHARSRGRARRTSGPGRVRLVRPDVRPCALRDLLVRSATRRSWSTRIAAGTPGAVAGSDHA
jgi:hypothetical protein